MTSKLIHITGDNESKELVRCLSAQISQIEIALAGVPHFDDEAFRKSSSIRDALDKALGQENGWHVDFAGTDAIPSKMHNKNYVLDYATDSDCERCQSKHRVLLEVAFDNRQAIGTNLLKLEVAQRYFNDRTGGNALGVLVCASRKALQLGGWDPGVGDENEYQLALDTAYRGIIGGSKVLLVFS